MNKNPPRHPALDVDDIPVNPSSKPWLNEVASSRRQLLKGSLGLAIGSFFGSSLAAGRPLYSAQAEPGQGQPLIGFKSVEVQLDPHFDRVIVAEGYEARPFFSWGDPVLPGAAPWRADASNPWQEQEQQCGQNNDGMAYFPFPEAPNDHGLLVVNHEYINPTLHPRGPTVKKAHDGSLRRPADEVKKEQAAHGVSVIEIRKDAQGVWQRVQDSRYNRRLTSYTPMAITGPAAGHETMRTQGDPSGTRVLGTLNNCSMGKTPWGTYLICEENWHTYFVNRNRADWQSRPSHWRNGVGCGAHSENNYWESVDPRFDCTPQADAPHQGYVNEPNRFGWVVEFDPFDPSSAPKKRTALGRFSRECATVALAPDGSLAIYSGDDTKGEYVYKFVPRGKYDPANPQANRQLLEEGTLYVASYHQSGKGQWLPLVQGQGGLTPRNGFFTQADVVIKARQAADIMGATPMDRPEWVAVDPRTREAYVSLTNNVQRGVAGDQPVNVANTRAENHHGQILRWREADDSPRATEFDWEIFLLAGKRDLPGTPLNERGDIRGDLFSCPDGLWFDGEGRLWIETDFDDGDSAYAEIGTNQLLCADPLSRQVKRFLVGPRGCELTGLTGTPDGKTLWCNIQHPKLSYPASDGKTRPRSTTLVITKKDGGVIGS